MKIEFALYDGTYILLDNESEVHTDEDTALDADAGGALTGSEPESEEHTDISGVADMDDSLGGEVGTNTDILGGEGRLLLDTPLDEYTVTEGLLLIVVMILALGGIMTMFRGR